MALMIWAPMQYAQAGMIGTEQVVAAAAQADRNAVLNFIGRAEVTSQLQSLGIDPATAKDRVAAMSDQEVQQLAGRIQTMPAGASDAGWILFIVVVAAVVWWVWFRR
jgi:hypothetical protein